MHTDFQVHGSHIIIMYLNNVKVPTEQESFSGQERFKQMEINNFYAEKEWRIYVCLVV